MYIVLKTKTMNLFDKAKSKKEKNTIDCIMCGMEFVPHRGSIERGWGKFCGRECTARFRNSAKVASPSELKAMIREERLRSLGL